jgi:creatinine amidohydrolase
VKVSDRNWMAIEAYLRHARHPTAVVPLGCTEQHAYLSLATDSILAEKVALDAAEPLGIPVFPTVNYGITPTFLGWPGTVTLRVETFLHVVRDILDSLQVTGFQRVLLVNGHGGNTPVTGLVREWLATSDDVKVKLHNWWSAPKTLAQVNEIDPVASHASWMECFPWTRAPGVDAPDTTKPMCDMQLAGSLSPTEMRTYVGDGNFGGVYQKPDDVMLALWEVAVAETREVLEGPWGLPDSSGGVSGRLPGMAASTD